MNASSDIASRIRIGNQTFFAAAITHPFEYALAHRFDAFEFFPDINEAGVGWRATDLNTQTRTEIRDRAKSADMQLAVHAPSWITSARDLASDQLTESQQLAQDLGATLINIHLMLEDSIPAFAATIRPLATRLAPSGITLSIENTPMTPPAAFNALFETIESWPSEARSAIGMCLDLGHANLCEATVNDYLGFIERLSDRVPIVHVHLHENYGDTDSHLPIFTGPSADDPHGIERLIQRLLQRGFKGSMILEQWPQPLSLLDQIRNRLRAMISAHASETKLGPKARGV